MSVVRVAYFGQYGCIILGHDRQGWCIGLSFIRDAVVPKTRCPSEQKAKTEFESLVKKYNAKLA